ncbi:N-acetylmuramoyl-L-alanine amidase [Candidatus Aerophobetes bacterium]|uniref:N-acetylmuramoyl-L-alanine amidase n=1 Tax=Aerophobetes bacterium TaxID=2030807 RepID=A0A523W375_UNCAE|nr:MAG: N-acetylmuramoyl-L-alanine amidase [Candidatus Aerophobetes bacterium]
MRIRRWAILASLLGLVLATPTFSLEIDSWQIDAYVGWEFLDMEGTVVFDKESSDSYPFVRGQAQHMKEAGERGIRVEELKTKWESFYTPLVIVAFRKTSLGDTYFRIIDITCKVDSSIYQVNQLGRFEYMDAHIPREAFGKFNVPSNVEYTCFWLLPAKSLIEKVYLRGHMGDGARKRFNIEAEHRELRHDEEESTSRREEEVRPTPPSPKPEESIYIVVLDPGHGGKDPGAIGRDTGLKAKEVTLQVAKLVATLLNKEVGMKAYLTRNTDEYLSLDRRAEIANQLGGDVFVSIDVNSSHRRGAKGVETFFDPRYSHGDGAKEAAARGDISLGSEDVPDEAKLIIGDLIQDEYRSGSNHLAQTVQEELVQATDMEDRGVKSAGFYVLRGAAMPAVLVMVGFLSNAQEERMLGKKEFMEKIASGIARGVRRYYEESDSSRESAEKRIVSGGSVLV